MNTALIEGGVAVGGWVLIHVGFALSVIDEAHAQETLDTLASLPSFDDEIALLAAPSAPVEVPQAPRGGCGCSAGC